MPEENTDFQIAGKVNNRLATGLGENGKIY